MMRVGFRQKVLLLAVTLVTVIQIGTLLPVLTEVKQEADFQADRSVRLAGVAFDEFMRSRTAQLATTADLLVTDPSFRDAVAIGERPTMESALDNHAARAGTDTAVVFDVNGEVLVSTGFSTDLRANLMLHQVVVEPGRDVAIHAVTYIDDTLYQTVTVPVLAPVTIAWVMLGFPMDDALAADVEALTGLEVSFLRFGVGRVDISASTLGEAERSTALAGVHLGVAADNASIRSDDFVTSLHPFLSESDGVYAALQLPMSDATASYTGIRNLLFSLTGFSLVLAVVGAIWISGMVTRPMQDLAGAARRLQEGVYTEVISISATDEFGDLAAGFNSMQDAIAQRERRIFHIAHHDSLSGLPTRDVIVSQLRDKIADAEQLAVINVALNRFDGIGSSLGHQTADEVIKLIAGQLRTGLKEDQIIGHLQQQEFVLVLPGYGEEHATAYFHGVQDILRAGVTVNKANISLHATAGLSLFPEHSADPTELLRCAAIARSDARDRVEPIVTYRPGRESRALQLIRIVGDFPQALKSNQLELEFQPKIDCESWALVGAEALVRWRHPDLGVLSPESFVNAIEQAGGIGHLTRWMLKEAINCCADWRHQGVNISMAVNISVDDLVDEYLPYFLLEITSRRDLRPSDVTLEVTESAIMNDVQMSLAVVSCLRELGFRVAVDDFGTGQSALAQLKQMPVDELKIDKSFVQNMDDQRDEAIVRATINLGHQFRLGIAAEGVESAEALERLRQLGCEYAQGFHISRPLPRDEFLRWARRWARANGSDVLSLVKTPSSA